MSLSGDKVMDEQSSAGSASAGLSRRSFSAFAVALAAAGLGGAKLVAAATGEESRLRFRRGYAQGPYGQVHYLDTGEGVPLVLLHQSPMSLWQFNAVYQPLADRGIRAIGIDSPGFGLSDPVDGLPSMEKWARNIAPVLDDLGIDKTNLLGNHTGSMLATEFAITHPERIDKLILNGAMIISDEDRAERLAGLEARKDRDPYDPDGKHLGEGFQRRKKFYGPGADDAVITRYMVDRFFSSVPGWHGPYAAFSYDHNAAIMKITVPTMVLANSGDMIFEPTMRAVEMRPDFASHVIEGGGVDITDQKTEEWVEAVANFILS
jgi:pimeloyl-ACP methyl ester carboxylesterase